MRFADLAFNNVKFRFAKFRSLRSDDPQNPGYLPQLTMVVTKHDNLMNLRACAVVLVRTFKFFVENA